MNGKRSAQHSSSISGLDLGGRWRITCSIQILPSFSILVRTRAAENRNAGNSPARFLPKRNTIRPLCWLKVATWGHFPSQRALLVPLPAIELGRFGQAEPVEKTAL